MNTENVHSNWLGINGDETYALNWDINSRSLVWEIGGFEGRWAAQIAEKYNPNIEIFEPQSWAVARMEERFKDKPKVLIYPYGLWVCDMNLPLYYYETDGASVIHEGTRSQICTFRDIHTELEGEIDLCLMNIEGAEYVLLPYLIGTGKIRNIRQFWCQFHPFMEGGAERKKVIYEKMSITHRLHWDFFPTAVAWVRK